jgi:hypothetical protein
MAAAALPNPLPFPAPEANPQPKQSPAFKPWQHKVLHLLSKGASVAKAMRCVGLTEDAFYKACTRHPEFKQHASAARELHIATVAETFHEAEAYARSYLDALLHDPEAPIALRLRVALAILNRKPGTWLPSPIPTIEEATEIPDTLDTLDALDTSDSSNAPDILDTLDNAAAQATPDILDKLDKALPAGYAKVEPITRPIPQNIRTPNGSVGSAPGSHRSSGPECCTTGRPSMSEAGLCSLN